MDDHLTIKIITTIEKMPELLVCLNLVLNIKTEGTTLIIEIIEDAVAGALIIELIIVDIVSSNSISLLLFIIDRKWTPKSKIL